MSTETNITPLQDAFVTSRIDALKGGLQSVHAPDALEAKLVGQFRKHAAKSARPRLWWMPPMALAATVALVSWMVSMPSALVKPEAGPLLDASEESAFLALRPLERIAIEPGATVVTTEFPRALLADWGLPVAPERAGEPVRAELLYSAQGEPLAVRLIQ